MTTPQDTGDEWTHTMLINYRIDMKHMKPAEAYVKAKAAIKEHYKRDADIANNFRTVARASIPAEWLEPVSGNKLYNQTSLDAAVLAARIEELENEIKARKDGRLFTIHNRIAELKQGDKHD